MLVEKKKPFLTTELHFSEFLSFSLIVISVQLQTLCLLIKGEFVGAHSGICINEIVVRNHLFGFVRVCSGLFLAQDQVKHTDMQFSMGIKNLQHSRYDIFLIFVFRNMGNRTSLKLYFPVYVVYISVIKYEL